MKSEILIPTLTVPERLWLEEIYPRNLAGTRFTNQDIWSKLYKSLPSSFRPSAMDPRLVTAGGDQILLFGVIALQKNISILEKVNKVIEEIKKRILETPNSERVLIESIAKETHLKPSMVSFVLQLTHEFGMFYRGATSPADSLLLKDIEIGNNEDIYYRYIDFPGIEILIQKKSLSKFRPPIEGFTFEEIASANDKLDSLINDVAILKVGQELIYTDVVAELNELKAMYFLGKKTWRQVLIGKISEMVAGGIVSDTVSKQIEEILKPVFEQLLPFHG